MVYIEKRWSILEDFPDYAVSNHGQVMSLKYGRTLKYRFNSYGHARVALIAPDGKRHDVYVHHLVAREFLTGYRKGLHVKHRDGDQANCHVSNLQFRAGLGTGVLKKPTDERMIRKVLVVETGAIFRNVETCAVYYDTHPSNIYRVLRGEREKHLGLSFERVYVAP